MLVQNAFEGLLQRSAQGRRRRTPPQKWRRDLGRDSAGVARSLKLWQDRGIRVRTFRATADQDITAAREVQRQVVDVLCAEIDSACWQASCSE